MSILHSIMRNEVWSHLGFNETVNKKYNTSVGTREVDKIMLK